MRSIEEHNSLFKQALKNTENYKNAAPKYKDTQYVSSTVPLFNPTYKYMYNYTQKDTHKYEYKHNNMHTYVDGFDWVRTLNVINSYPWK